MLDHDNTQAATS